MKSRLGKTSSSTKKMYQRLAATPALRAAAGPDWLRQSAGSRRRVRERLVGTVAGRGVAAVVDDDHPEVIEGLCPEPVEAASERLRPIARGDHDIAAAH